MNPLSTLHHKLFKDSLRHHHEPNFVIGELQMVFSISIIMHMFPLNLANHSSNSTMTILLPDIQDASKPLSSYNAIIGGPP